MTQVQQTTQPAARHMTLAKLLGQLFAFFPPLSQCPLVNAHVQMEMRTEDKTAVVF